MNNADRPGTVTRMLLPALCAVMLLTSVAGCQKAPVRATESPAAAVTETPAAETAAPTPEATATKKAEKIPFKTHVYNSFLEEIMGEKMHTAYDALIDAVLEGKDSFACPDKETYDWVRGQLPYLCFPVMAEYLDFDAVPVRYKDGKGYFTYKIPEKEFRQKLAEFETLITDVMNEAVKPEYTDFEKMLAVYGYFAEHYTYDYELMEKNERGDYKDVNAYDFFVRKTNICQGISVAYSYILMQLGLDACVVKGPGHQWSIVKYKGHYYHIDPTFAMTNSGSMEYFLMDDERRTLTGYDPKNYTFASVYAQDHPHPDYPCDDDSYSELWTYWYGGINPDAHTVKAYYSAEKEEDFVSVIDISKY